jgi:hypothetical protein
MNILVNVTLVLQIIHFMVAYAIIRFIFLRPAVALMMAKEKQRTDMRESIAYKYMLIDREKEMLQKDWQASCLFYDQHAPTAQEADGGLVSQSYGQAEYPQVSDAVAQELIVSATQELVKKVRAL